MTPELKQEIESARELARTGDYNEHPCEIGYAETIVDLADRIEQLEAEVKTALHREAETTARYDAKIDALEAEIEKLRLERQAQYDRGYYDGRQYDGAEERAKIVAWLRLNSTPHNDIDEWADEIEAGAHLK